MKSRLLAVMCASAISLASVSGGAATLKSRDRHRSVFTLLGVVLFLQGCTSIQPINVHGGTFFDESCPRAHTIYTVPERKLLIIEDASTIAVESATASIRDDPGIVDGVPIRFWLRTNPTGTVTFGSADHLVASGIGLPIAGGRKIKGYAAPGTRVVFLMGGCNVEVNSDIYFSGRLIDYP